MRLLYRDNAGNEYRTGERTVAIVDRRRSPAGPDARIPVEIRSADESGAYKDVRSMDIGAGG